MSARASPAPYRLPRGSFDYVEYSAPVVFAEAEREASLFSEMLSRREEVPVLFHPVHLNLFGPELEGDGVLAAIADHVGRVGSPWVSNDLAWWHTGQVEFPGYLYIAPPLDERSIEPCVAHALHVQSRLPVPLVFENPAVIDPRGELHIADFLSEVHARSGLDVLLDVGHLYSHQLARGLELFDGLDRLPWAAIAEIHIAGGLVVTHGERRFYLDDHPQPVPEALFSLLAHALPRCPRLRAVTYEGDGHPDRLAIDDLARLRRMLADVPTDRVVEAATPRSSAAMNSPELAWRAFDEAYGGADDVRDPVAHEVEARFRLAVLAERLDRTFPMTRLLVAPTREGLSQFAASSELRRTFQAPGRSVPEAFATWARRRLLEHPDDALAAVLAFESWARHEAGHARGEAHLAIFPVDLSELLHATRTLKNDRSMRALLGATDDEVAFEDLAAIARRAPQRRWPVELKLVGERVLVTSAAERAA